MVALRLAESSQSDDVRRLSGQLQYPSAVAADKHWHALPRRRHQGAGVGVDAIVRAVEIDSPAVEQGSDQPDRFLQL